MGKFAVVVMLPDQEDAPPERVDFASREFDTWQEAIELMAVVEEKVPNWRLVTFCHVEDLPMLMEGPKPDDSA